MNGGNSQISLTDEKIEAVGARKALSWPMLEFVYTKPDNEHDARLVTNTSPVDCLITHYY